MPRALWETDEEGIAARHPMRRIGAPDDIAGAALYLASDTASWLTGALLVIDGGLSLVLARIHRCALRVSHAYPRRMPSEQG